MGTMSLNVNANPNNLGLITVINEAVSSCETLFTIQVNNIVGDELNISLTGIYNNLLSNDPNFVPDVNFISTNTNLVFYVTLENTGVPFTVNTVNIIYNNITKSTNSSIDISRTDTNTC